jgi:hypothetical protein
MRVPIRPTCSSVLGTTRCPLPATSFTITITPPLTEIGATLSYRHS